MNKRVFLSMMMSVGMALSAAAQNGSESKFHFGLQFSPSYTWMKVDGASLKNDGGKIGLSYGLMTEFAISKNYAFATGLEISYRGGRYANKVSLPDNFTVTQKLQYVEIPLGLKLKTNEIGYITYYGLFGAMPGLLVKAREDIDFENGSANDIDDNGNQSNFYPFNVHLNVGAGIEYNLGGSTSFTAGLRYNNGLMDIYKGSEGEQFRTDGVVLNLGIFF